MLRSDWLPALWALSTTCMHLFKLNEEGNETATMSNYLHLFALHVTKTFSLNMLKTISLKIGKKTSIEEQSEDHALVHKTSESRLTKTNPKMPYRKREIPATPIQLHLKELHGECYPHTLPPNPEMKAVSYAGKTFGRCSMIFSPKSW